MWNLFTTRLEHVLCLAKQHVYRSGASMDHKKFDPKNVWNEKVRVKDQCKFIHTQTPQGTRHQPCSSFRERKLQRQVYRLAEMLALERRHRADSTQFRILKQKLGRNLTLRKLRHGT